MRLRVIESARRARAFVLVAALSVAGVPAAAQTGDAVTVHAGAQHAQYATGDSVDSVTVRAGAQHAQHAQYAQFAKDPLLWRLPGAGYAELQSTVFHDLARDNGSAAQPVLELLAIGPLARSGQPAFAAAMADSEPFFTRRDALLALGFAAGTVAMAPLDRSLAAALQDSSLQAHAALRNLAGTLRVLGFPGTVIIGSSAYAVGRVGNMPRVAAIGLHGTEAVVLANVFVGAGKTLLGRARPVRNPDDPFDFGFLRGLREGSDYRAFPSGHTAAAFAAAAAVTAETREIWPEATPYAAPVLYGGALLVGVSRMYHNRHWASDVVVGAAVGTFSGLKVVRYHYRNPDNPVDRWLLPSAVLPGDGGFIFVWTVPVR
jgi:membrane-associated phospholipid phosphatase